MFKAYYAKYFHFLCFIAVFTALNLLIAVNTTVKQQGGPHSRNKVGCQKQHGGPPETEQNFGDARKFIGTYRIKAIRTPLESRKAALLISNWTNF